MRRSFVAILCALLSSQASADVTVYRAVDYKNAQYAKINNNQWRIDPDGLSTFEGPHFNVPNKRCMVSFVIQGVSSDPHPPMVNQGPVQNMPVGTIGEYTPNHGGTGHWSIQGPNNNVGLPAALTTYVIGNNMAAVNPTYTGTNQSQCMTPAAPNASAPMAARKPHKVRHRPSHRKRRGHGQ